MSKNLWFQSILSWFCPGAGYFLSGNVWRGIIIGGAIWLMFIIGLISGGAEYPGYGWDDGFLLYLLNIFAEFGNGLGLLILKFFQSGNVNAAASPTFEYGGKFLEVAGLLNYLAAIDTYDVAAGRKK